MTSHEIPVGLEQVQIYPLSLQYPVVEENKVKRIEERTFKELLVRTAKDICTFIETSSLWNRQVPPEGDLLHYLLEQLSRKESPKIADHEDLYYAVCAKVRTLHSDISLRLANGFISLDMVLFQSPHGSSLTVKEMVDRICGYWNDILMESRFIGRIALALYETGGTGLMDINGMSPAMINAHLNEKRHRSELIANARAARNHAAFAANSAINVMTEDPQESHLPADSKFDYLTNNFTVGYFPNQRPDSTAFYMRDMPRCVQTETNPNSITSMSSYSVASQLNEKYRRSKTTTSTCTTASTTTNGFSTSTSANARSDPAASYLKDKHRRGKTTATTKPDKNSINLAANSHATPTSARPDSAISMVTTPVNLNKELPPIPKREISAADWAYHQYKFQGRMDERAPAAADMVEKKRWTKAFAFKSVVLRSCQ